MSNQKKVINAVRGMNDILAEDIPYWQYIESYLQELSTLYNYIEIKLPIVEKTDLFKRSVGLTTDIVEKEMYVFADRNGDSLALRPEGTAGVVRAGLEHSLFYGQKPKFWYLGPMFRHERPQKGRYRQFYQFGAEIFGYEEPYIDAEVLAFNHRLWQKLGLSDKIKLEINSLGTREVREKYKQDLIKYLKDNFDSLDTDSKNRIDTNPLRVLDSKNPDLKDLINKAPKLPDYLDDYSKEHFSNLCSSLDDLNIEYRINPYLVRGLDYYNLTVFEWVTDELGAQGTVCAGGRYNGLVEQINGQYTDDNNADNIELTPAIGFSIGIERLVLMLKNHIKLDNKLDLYIVTADNKAMSQALLLAEELRDNIPNLQFTVNYSKASFKSQLKKADKLDAKMAILIGEDELANNYFTVKWLRENKPQQQLSKQYLINLLSN